MIAHRLAREPTESIVCWIYVVLSEQKLFVAWTSRGAPGTPLAGAASWFQAKAHLSLAIYVCSTGAKPSSQLEGSGGTPLGLHLIADRIGDGQPLGTIFKGRVPIGRTKNWRASAEESNLITTRILRLRGLEVGFNAGNCSLAKLALADRERASALGGEGAVSVDSYDRYIYVHGTNHEQRLGEPFSGGCIELGNEAIANLFPWIPLGTPVMVCSDWTRLSVSTDSLTD